MCIVSLKSVPNIIYFLGGTFIISFSNRYFPTKVIDAWTRTGDAGRINIVWVYFRQKTLSYRWKTVQVFDISKEKDRHKFQNRNEHLQGEYSDPMYVLMGEKL